MPLIGNALADQILRRVGKHVHDGIPHVLAVKHPASLVVYQLALLVHDLIVIQQVLADSEVVALYLLLRPLDGFRKHPVLYRFIVRDVEGVECVQHTLSAE